MTKLALAVFIAGLAILLTAIPSLSEVSGPAASTGSISLPEPHTDGGISVERGPPGAAFHPKLHRRAFNPVPDLSALLGGAGCNR